MERPLDEQQWADWETGIILLRHALDESDAWRYRSFWAALERLAQRSHEQQG